MKHYFYKKIIFTRDISTKFLKNHFLYNNLTGFIIKINTKNYILNVSRETSDLYLKINNL